MIQKMKSIHNLNHTITTVFSIAIRFTKKKRRIIIDEEDDEESNLTINNFLNRKIRRASVTRYAKIIETVISLKQPLLVTYKGGITPYNQLHLKFYVT